MEAAKYNNNRNYLLDNLKFILITLVVLGHFWGAYVQQAVFFRVIVTCIYSFHMPVFVFISGYFTKSTKSLIFFKLTANMLIPYFIFFMLWQAKEYVHSGSFSFSFFEPPFHLWYLLSLFFWNLLLPTAKQFKHYLFLSVIGSLLIGISQSISASSFLERTISLFPFFVLGELCNENMLLSLRKRKIFIFLGVITLIVIGYITWRYNGINFNFLLWDRSYAAAGYDFFTGAMFRVLLIIVSLLAGLFLLALIPLNRTIFTTAGSRTLPIYILHGFIYPTFVAHFGLWGESTEIDIIIIAFPLLLTCFLSLPVVDLYYKRFINFIVKLVMRNTGEPLKEPI